jgi:hypothetical protein
MTRVSLLGKEADGLFGPYGLSAPWIDRLAQNNGQHSQHERAQFTSLIGLG